MSSLFIASPRILHALRLGAAFCLLFCLVAGVSILFAQGDDAPPLILTDTQGEYSLGPYIEILRDPTLALTVQEVAAPALSGRFVPNQQNIPSLGVTRDAIWLRFRVSNQAAGPVAWLLALHEIRHGTVDLYIPNQDGSFRVLQTGRNLPFGTRDVPNRAFVFRLDAPPGEEQTYYMRLTSASPMTIPLKVWSPQALSAYDQQDILWYGLFYGAMLIMAGYNLFLFFSLRDRSYLYLALFILTYALNQATRDGLAHQYLFPNFSNRYIGELSGVLFDVFLILYSVSLLETARRVPRIHRLLVGIAIALPIWFVSALFIPLNAISLILLLASFVLMGLAGYLVWRQGYRPARLYLLSWLLFFVVAFLFVLNSLDPFLGSVISDKPLLVAVAVGTLLGSLALADRVNLLKSQAEDANQELERSEQKYRSLFDNSRDGIFISTREGKILDLNPTMLDMFGMVRADVEKISARDLYADPLQRDQMMGEIQARGYVHDYPLQLLRIDGSPMTAIVTVTDWHDEHTGQRGFQGAIRDVTAQRQLEAQLAEQIGERERAVAEERGRLARDLHDSVTQALYSIGLYANAADRSLQHSKPEAAASHIKQVIQLALEAMVDMRSLIFELQPPILEQLGLAPALKTRLQAVEGRAGVAVEFNSSGVDRLSPATQSELYHIAQEALANVVKHAQAQHVWVNLDYAQDHATLEIRDDGNGFDPVDVKQKNTMGLRSIRERAQKINGVLTVEGNPGQGTCIRIEVPYE